MGNNGVRRRLSVSPARRRVIFSLFLAAVVVSASVAAVYLRGRSVDDGEVLALVGRHPITKGDFKLYLESLPEFYRPYAVANRSQVLQDLIDREMIYRAARRQRFDRLPAYRKQLAALGKELLVQEYVRRKIGAGQLFAEDQLRRYFEANRQDFVQPESVYLSEIMVADRGAAEQVIGRLRRGENFDDLAREVSEAPSRHRGGDLGFVPRGGLPPRLEREAFALSPREFSAPIETETGWYLLFVSARIPSRRLEFEEALPAVRRVVASANEEDVFNNLVSELRRVTRVEIREDNLEQMDF